MESNKLHGEPAQRDHTHSKTGARPGGPMKDMLRKLATNLGTLHGVRYFWKELMSAKIGTNEIEAQSMKNTRETIQRSVNKDAIPKRDEEAVMEMLKLRYKGVKKNVKEVSREMEKLFRDYASRVEIEEKSKAWKREK